MKNYNYIDLFAGCGGLSLGLHLAGWQGLFAIEKSKDAFTTLKYNLIDGKDHFEWPVWLRKRNHNIDSVINNHQDNLLKLRGQVTLVAGGPPCQGFSTAGARKESDKRNDLVDSYIEFVRLVQPKMLFFENVKGFTFEFRRKNSKGKTFSDKVITGLENLGYSIHAKIINFADYGVPQSRHRFILIGIKDGSAEEFFKILENNKNFFFQAKGINSYNTLGDAISDLLANNGMDDSVDSPGFCNGIYSSSASNYQDLMRRDLNNNSIQPDSHRFARHNDYIIEIFENLLKIAERNKRVSDELKEKFNVKKRSLVPLAKDEPCPVLTSHPDDYIHFSEPRILTVREYARIQSFPDWYEFKGKYTTGSKKRKKEVPRYTQLGNAIPPLFAEQTGLALKQLV